MAISLTTLRRGPQHRPPRMIVYGPEKIGKSTFAASAGKPIFIPTEDGVDALDVTSFPLATTLDDVREAIGVLATEDHDFQTVVVDSADWLEGLIHKKVAGEHNAATIQGTGNKGDSLGYGKGYVLALAEWREIIEGLDLLRNEKNMTIILLAHYKIKRFDDPTSDSYDRFMLDLHDSSSSLLKEWCDIIGFLNLRISLKETDAGFNRKIVKGKSGGDRMLYLEDRPGFVAGNRYGLPDEIQIPREHGWSSFERELIKVMTPKTQPDIKLVKEK
jgi:hypothetical protein